MEIQVARELFMHALERCSYANQEKSPSQTHKSVLLESQGDKQLLLFATNTFLSIDTRVVAIVKKPGGVVMDTKYLLDAVRRMPSGYINLSVDEKTLRATLQSDVTRRKFNLSAFSADIYPKLPDGAKDQPELGMATGDFLGLIKRAAYPLHVPGAKSSSADRTRFHGVMLFCEQGKLTACAIEPSSSRAFGYAFGAAPEQPEFAAFIPEIAHDCLLSLAKDDKDLRVRVTASAVLVECGATVIHTQLPTELYPNQQWRIPLAQMPTTVDCRLDADRLLDAAGAVCVVANSVVYFLRLTLAGGALTVQLVDSDHAAEDKLEVDGSGAFSVHVDPHILSGALKSLGSEITSLSFESTWNALILRTEKVVAMISIMIPPPAPVAEEPKRGRGARKTGE